MKLAALLAAAFLIAFSSTVSAGNVNTMGREVYAFFGPANRAYMLDTADYSVLTTVAYFGLEALPDGSLRTTTAAGKTTSERRGWESDWLQQVIAKAHTSGAKVVLTVTRFGWSASSRETSKALLNDPDALDALVDNVADEVVAKGVDGVNVDFEPMWSDVGPAFVGFLRGLRTQLDVRKPGLDLTFDITGYSSGYPIDDALAPGAADSVYIMAYPWATANSARAGAVSPMAGLRYDVTEAVDTVLAQTTPDKVILGLPNFGFQWPTRTKNLHALTYADAALYGSPGALNLEKSAGLAARYGRRWDAEQLVPWTRWRARACSSCPLIWHELYYDDTQSIGIKYDLVNDDDLRGVGIWHLNYGPDRSDFYAQLKDKFGNTRQVTQ
jgi:spore germination protein YaaH